MNSKTAINAVNTWLCSIMRGICAVFYVFAVSNVSTHFGDWRLLLFWILLVVICPVPKRYKVIIQNLPDVKLNNDQIEDIINFTDDNEQE